MTFSADDERVELLEHATELIRGTLGSPWLWVLVFAIAGLDALLPFMPSETTVVTVAVLIGPDLGTLALLVVVSAAGAWAGDCLGYAVGRAAGPRAVAWLQRGPSGRQRYEWARDQVRRQAPLLIIAARYLPGGRVASALANGSLGYPLRRFVPLDAVGAALWSVYSALIGLMRRGRVRRPSGVRPAAVVPARAAAGRAHRIRPTGTRAQATVSAWTRHVCWKRSTSTPTGSKPRRSPQVRPRPSATVRNGQCRTW